MRLTSKLTLVLISVMTLIFSIYGYLSIRRQSLFFEQDMRMDGQLIGHTLGKAATNIWHSQGREKAIEFVDQINHDYQNLRIRIVQFDKVPNSDLAPSIELSNQQIAQLLNSPLLLKDITNGSEKYLYNFVPIYSPDGEQAAIEIRESFAPVSRFVEISGIRIAILLTVIILSTGGVMWALGIFLVARPISKLSEKTRRIAQGDYSGTAFIKGNDEIAILGQEINKMSDNLLETRKLLDKESIARVNAVEQLRHADRLTTIGTLASGLAHELGTPLNVLSGNLQLCEKNTQSFPTVNETILSSLEQTEKMGQIIKQLLDFARARTPKKALTDISIIAEKAIRTLAPFAMKRQIIIKFDFDGGPAFALVDITQIEQVIINLLLNAIQSMFEGGEITVGIDDQGSVKSIESKHKFLRLWIKDQGSGIDETEIKRIFDPFYTTKDIGQGTGMGLSIAYGIIKEHDGWIEVESEINEGTCFTINLPCEEALQ